MVALQEMNLAYEYPTIFWNTANLIVDSGGAIDVEYDEEGEASLIVENEHDEDEEDEDLEEWEEENEVDSDVSEDKKKEKSKTVDYGKVAAAIGKFSNYGITVAAPNINSSSFTFTPVVKDNTILYGLRGITRLSASIIKNIMDSRPYTSMVDFLSKVKINKVQMINLIKCGAFDTLENKPREAIMHDYLMLITDKKQDVNLRNMQMLINKDLIPDDMVFYGKLFMFNKFLKSQKATTEYQLNQSAINFISNNFSADYINNGNTISVAVWSKLYDRGMNPMRIYLKEHKQEVLDKLNESLYQELADKYAKGTISHWEMESVSFYSHPHELASVSNRYDDFFSLPEEPVIENVFTTKSGDEIKMYKLAQIVGTVIDKNKLKNTVTLLTPTGVVNVKVYKNQFALYDKQISQIGDDGKKHVIEPSWFKRGTLLMIQGIRRGADFIPKKYKSSVYPVISKITEVTQDNQLVFQYNRTEVT